MKKYEIESLLKNFFIFFTILEIFLSFIFFQNYQEQKSILKNKIFNKMYNCSWTLSCEEFSYDIIPKQKSEFKLKFDKNYYAIFNIANSKKYSLKIVYPQKSFSQNLSKIKQNILLKFFLYSTLLAILTLIISLYTLKPIKNAMKLNEEFIKDILHDLNTPLSTIIFNLSMIRDDKYIKYINRINSSIKTIISLQNNLKTFLRNIKERSKDKINVNNILLDSVENIQSQYSDIKINIQQSSTIYIRGDKDLLYRVFENILSNSAKYNSKKDKKIKIVIFKNSITIQDNGDGIYNTQKIFDRYYKEKQRGIGIGLNIVKKICDEMNIKINVSSKIDIGTTFKLTFVTDE